MNKEEVIMSEKVIPSKYIPDKGSYVENIDGKEYLISNDAMYTFYRRSKGEFSPFFLAIRDEKRLLGCRCKSCGIVRVPPFLTHCPDCNFSPTELIEVGQTGALISTPPITYFATSLFQDMAPYGRGRVVFDGADTAISINLYTTTGILRPGILKKGTRVKLVFRDKRIGEMTDIFCVPEGELTKEQVEKKGLQESDINWESPVEPGLPDATDADIENFKELFDEIVAVVDEMNRNDRAKKDILGWRRKILVKTKGGEFSIIIDDGNIQAVPEKVDSPDFVMVSEDPKTLLKGHAYRGAITDSVIDGRLWISKNKEFNTIFKLDRMARSVARSKKKRSNL